MKLLTQPVDLLLLSLLLSAWLQSAHTFVDPTPQECDPSSTRLLQQQAMPYLCVNHSILIWAARRLRQRWRGCWAGQQLKQQSVYCQTKQTNNCVAPQRHRNTNILLFAACESLTNGTRSVPRVITARGRCHTRLFSIRQWSLAKLEFFKGAGATAPFENKIM